MGSTMTDDNNYYIAVLQCVEGLGAMGIRRMVEYFGSPGEAWKALLQGDPNVFSLGIGSLKREHLKKINLEDIPEALQRRLTYWDIHIVTYKDPMYPPQLKNIYNPPAVLFYRGNEKILRTEKGIAVVGARRCTEYGRNVATEFSYRLAQAGVVIISGGARGIDGCAHKGALHAKAPTIAVMGCGLDITYPREHGKLFRDILIGGGVLVSEYPPGSKPLAAHFPMRNRIISGLARAAVVVEAKAASGSLITADMAVNDGRDVFAVPGNVLTKASEGTNWLLRQGAMVLTSPQDILDEYGWGVSDAVIKKDSSHNERGVLSCTLEEKKILDLLSYTSPRSVNEMAKQGEVSLSSLHTLLLQLELKGLVKQTSPGNYIMVTLGRNQFVD